MVRIISQYIYNILKRWLSIHTGVSKMQMLLLFIIIISEVDIIISEFCYLLLVLHLRSNTYERKGVNCYGLNCVP